MKKFLTISISCMQIKFMKQKFLLLFLLVALILTGCSKMSEEKIETLETRPECNGEHVEVDIPEEDLL